MSHFTYINEKTNLQSIILEVTAYEMHEYIKENNN